MDPISPPAIFRSNVNELIAQGKSLNEGIKRDERAAIEKAIALGKICIKLKEDAGEGGYGKALEAMGLAHQRASEYARMARLPVPAVQKAGSLNDLHQAISEQPTAQPTPPPNPFGSNFCQRCNRNRSIGRAVPLNCEDCKALKTPKKAPGKPQAAPPKDDLPETEEARDLEAQEQAAEAAKKAAAEAERTNGQEVLNWKTFTGHFSQIVQTVDRVAKAYEFKESPEHRAMHDLLREFLKDFRRNYEARSNQKLPER